MGKTSDNKKHWRTTKERRVSTNCNRKGAKQKWLLSARERWGGAKERNRKGLIRKLGWFVTYLAGSNVCR